MRPKLVTLSLFFLFFIPSLVFAEEENVNIVEFEIAADAQSYHADAYSLINVESDEIYNLEGEKLPDGTVFQVSILSVDNTYDSKETNFSNYFEAISDISEDDGFQVILTDGKLNFSFKAGVISGLYRLAASSILEEKQYYGDFWVRLSSFTPLVLEDVDIIPERPDLKDDSKVAISSYTPTLNYEVEFSPIHLTEKEGKDVFRLNIWSRRSTSSEETIEQVRRYDIELDLPNVTETGEYTLRVYQNGTVIKEHVFNIEPSTVVWLFTDVNSRHWAYNYIKALVDEEIVSGYSGGSFRPENHITRAEFLKIVLNGSGTEILTGLSSDFSDLDDDSWCKDYIMTAKGLGIVSGYSDETFRPNQPILRQEASKIILEAFKIATIRVIEPTFDDVSEEWLTYIETGVVYDFWHGRSERMFEPRDYITRAEVSKIVDRIWDLE